MSYIDGLNPDFFFCRDLLHAWDPYSMRVTRGTARKNEVHQTLLCVRCGTLKTRVLTVGGQILRYSYTYPDGYLAKDQGTMSPADRAMIRAINIKRLRKEEKND